MMADDGEEADFLREALRESGTFTAARRRPKDLAGGSARADYVQGS
jgi:hypothetical protein